MMWYHGTESVAWFAGSGVGCRERVRGKCSVKDLISPSYSSNTFKATCVLHKALHSSKAWCLRPNTPCPDGGVAPPAHAESLIKFPRSLSDQATFAYTLGLQACHIFR